jgi:hypothetical protein
MEAQGERYSPYSFSTSALDAVSGQPHAPGRPLPPGKGPPVPIVQEAGWVPEPVWTQRLQEKSLASAGDRTSIARSSVARYYTEIPAHPKLGTLQKIRLQERWNIEENEVRAFPSHIG